MADIQAREDFPDKNVQRRPVFPGSAIGNNSGSFQKGGSSSKNKTNKTQDGEDADQIIPNYNSEYAENRGITTEFNKQSFNPIIGGRQNTINGQVSNFLAGGNNSSPNSSNDSSVSNAGQEGNGNSVTFMSSSNSAQKEKRNEKPNAQELNAHGCPGNQTYAYLTISSSDNSYLPTFVEGGCGCWVSTGADVFTLLSVLGVTALLGYFTKIPGFSKAGRLKNALDKIDDMAGRPKEQYQALLDLKPEYYNHATKVLVRQQIRKQILSGGKTIRRTFVKADGTEVIRDIPLDKIGSGNTFVIKQSYKAEDGTYFYKNRKVTIDQIIDDETEIMYTTWKSSIKKYFKDIEQTVELHGFGGVLEAKIAAYLNPLYTDFVTALVSGVVGAAFQTLSAATIYREKVCLGNNRIPKPNLDCECKCMPRFDQEACGTVSSSIIDNYTSAVQDYGLSWVFGSDELAHCGYGCCTGQTEIINSDGSCDCEDPDPSTYEFIQGSVYSPTGCNCRKKISSGITGIPPMLIPGIYMEKDVLAQQRAVGKIFNADNCRFECPEGSHVAEGLECGTLARLKDNLGKGAPTKEHYLYTTGCDCVCDGRDYASWPPVCGPYYEFNSDPLVCTCVDICSTGICKWVVQCSGCGDLNECIDDPDCSYNQVYFRSQEFWTEAEANAWIDENGHINCVTRKILEGTAPAIGSIDECP